MALSCFHLSIPVLDLESTESWYVNVLACEVGRRSADAVILNFFGHQLVAQRWPRALEAVEQPGVYPRHFGLVLSDHQEWLVIEKRVRTIDIGFAVEPKLRFPGEILEHRTFFLKDPAANWLEFKHYTYSEAILGCQDLQVVGDPRIVGSPAPQEKVL